ncbi:MAG: hypothetical protein IPI15_14745 [Saprospiraceae bacterium]|uniref:hypothetical protein n=1 Tax=Candidatus Brachybacter algidus TaxID=2982024 RepID=UPI00257CC627|nr:hypothetical protein [Candidatus Brachybacter algidus]MBK7604804.1 hypothetical protein [Candidatus Brachybacter algidus]
MKGRIKKSVVGDTLIFTLIHVTKEYNDFSSSKSNANSANGNPFGQPGQIKSNVSESVSQLVFLQDLRLGGIRCICREGAGG